MMSNAKTTLRWFAPALFGAAITFTGATAGAAAQRNVSLTLDNVHIGVYGATGIVLPSTPGDATQEATIYDAAHHRAVSIIAAPFGTHPGTEDALPPARHGGSAEYRAILHDFRVRTGEFATEAPAISLFGNYVEGDLSLRHEHLSDSVGRDLERDVFTAEWVNEAGSRLWIARVTQFEPANHALSAIADFALGLRDLSFASAGSTAAATTIVGDVAAAVGAPSRPLIGVPTAMPLKKPPAYSDGCDSDTYNGATGRVDWRHLLGASYRGVPACGPRPATGAPLIAARFSAATPPSVFEFNATELSLRWMFLTYATPPFAGNGDELLINYDATNGGQPLYKYVNAARSGVHPLPGDVLSYDTGGTGGHTGVVVNVHADRRGNGWLVVLEQNASVRGVERLPMRDGEILSNYGGPILGWLGPRPYR